MFKNVIAIVMLFGFTATAQAHVWLDVVVSSNSIGQDVYVVTANSDGAPITSWGVNVVSENGDLGQVHPMGFQTGLGDYNPFMAPPTAPDQDTQMLFSTAADNLLLPIGHIDTVYELNINFTGFQPFTSRGLVQVVLKPGGQGFATIGLVAEGMEHIVFPQTTHGPNGSTLNLPEPTTLALLTFSYITITRRRQTA